MSPQKPLNNYRHSGAKPLTFEIDGTRFVEMQTEAIKRKWKSSRPRPRNRAMGFKGEAAERVEELWRRP